jgi:hypothetical protein
MNRTATNKDLFMRLTSNCSTIGLSGRPWPQLYQHILRNKSFLNTGDMATVGQELISIAEGAHAFRRYDVVGQASDLIMALPLPQRFKSAGLYYRQLCISDMGRGDLQKATLLINAVIESAASKYCPQAMISLGAVYAYRGDQDDELDLYVEALRAARSGTTFDPATVITASRMISICKAKDGFHKGALRDLEGMLPLARMVRRADPFVYYDYLNSFAVELASADRWNEARRVSSLVFSSPYAIAYPEWQETYRETMLRVKRRSVLCVDVWPPDSPSRRKHAKILPMPSTREPSPQSEALPTGEPGRVIEFPAKAQAQPKKRKTRMGKPIDPSEIATLSADEKKFICAQILMERSGDKPKLDSLYNALPSGLRARALIELVIGTALQDNELTAILKHLMTDSGPEDKSELQCDEEPACP